MQFEVPQKIDLEDKVIGPLTLKQFFYLLAGGMLDYIWFRFFSFAIFVILALPTTAFFVAMALARVQDQPFPKFLGSLVLYTLRPKQRTWGRGAPLPKLMVRTPKLKQEIQPETKKMSPGELEKLATILDTKGWDKGEPEMKERVVSQPEARPKLNVETNSKLKNQNAK
ncbi:MAG TPA: PrgI family protein [Patescibacteria group bacterium]|nr:PrgI family protein [Patescibacteria group bacterium]